MFSHARFEGSSGVARTDITPPVGIYCRNWGAAAQDTADGVHGRLTLNAMVLKSQSVSSPLILVDADLGWWANLEVERIFRKKVLDELSIAPAYLLFALSHTHAAPPLCNPEPHWPGGKELADFLSSLSEQTIETVRQAIKNMCPAVLEWHYGKCSLATNRDLLDNRPGKPPRIVCGYNPEGPADDTVLVGRIADTDGKIFATVTNYACHPTTLAWGNTKISPDYVGAMRQTIESNTDGALAFFLQGASGELSPRYQYVGDTTVADSHGRELAFSALSALESMEPPRKDLVYDGVIESGAPLAVWSRQPRTSSKQPLTNSLAAVCRQVSVPLKNWPSAEALELEYANCSDRAIAERLRRKLRIRQAVGDGQSFSLEIWGWRLGNALIMGTMGEAYSSIQQNLRAAFPGQAVGWLNLVNGSIGYLPPANLYDEDIYQVWQTPFDRGSLELVERAAIELGRDMLAENIELA